MSALTVLTVAGLAILVGGYGLGVWRLWSRYGTGHGLRGWRVAGFAAGTAALAGSQLPPIDEAADRSFPAHMAQHMVLLLVAAPLFATGGVGLAMITAAPRWLRGRLIRVRTGRMLRWLRRPVPLASTVALVQAVVLWGWHLPVLYQAALDHEFIHLIEHGCFVGACWLLWAPIFGTGRSAFSGLAEIAVVFVAGIPAMGLGALFAFAPEPLYPNSILAPPGRDPLHAQQLAGMIMWIPMNVVYLVMSTAGLLRWLINYDRRMPSGHDLSPPEPVGSESEEVGV